MRPKIEGIYVGGIVLIVLVGWGLQDGCGCTYRTQRDKVSRRRGCVRWWMNLYAQELDDVGAS